jgi:transcriptional regulator with XRE-family HTH domain
MLTKFGEICRSYRAQRGLYLLDQAEGTNVSVSMVSAIERGQRSIPQGYAKSVAAWLGLDVEQTGDLVLSTEMSANVIKFRPKNEMAASLAFELTSRLNELTPSDIDRIRKLLEEGKKIYE